MRKPSDTLKASEAEISELEYEISIMAFALMENFNLSEQAAADIAEQVLSLQILTNLKNELEDS